MRKPVVVERITNEEAAVIGAFLKLYRTGSLTDEQWDAWFESQFPGAVNKARERHAALTAALGEYQLHLTNTNRTLTVLPLPEDQ